MSINNFVTIEGSTVSNDNVVIRYKVGGVGQPAVVFVHGWCCNQSYWNAQLAHFGSTHTVVTLDLAGHGGSGTRQGAYSMASFGQDVAAVVHHLDLEQVILIGHSMGGDVILEAANLLKNETIGLIGVDTFHDVEKIYTQERIAEIVSFFQADFSGATQATVRNMFMENADPNLVEQIVSHMSSAPPKVGIAALEGIYLSYPSTQILHQIQIPMFAINADGWVPTNIEGATSANIEVIMLQGLGHFLHVEAPEYFNQVLTDIISRIINLSS